MAIAAARSGARAALRHARRRRRVRTACSSRCGSAKASRPTASRSTPTRRPASISSPTVPQRPRVQLSARGLGGEPHGAVERCRCDVIRAGADRCTCPASARRSRRRRAMRRSRRWTSARSAGARVSYDTNLRLKLWPLRARARGHPGDARALRLVRCRASTTRGCCSTPTTPTAIIDACHRAGAPVVVLKRGARGCVVSDGARRERDRRACASRASTRRAPATASTARSPRGSSRATIRSPRRATRMRRPRSRRPATAPSRRCRATPTCARCSQRAAR